MSSTHRLATFVCGRRTKWVVLAFWVVALALLGPLAGKLTDAQKNDSKAWLPASAESTKALDQQAAFQSVDAAPALVVYERPSGITEADRAKAAADAKAFAGVRHVGPVQEPILSKDGKAVQVIAQIDFGSGGWQDLGKAVDQMRTAMGSPPAGLNVHITGPGGYAADSADAFKGIDSTLLYAAVGVVIVILLLTYRSPVLWLFPVLSVSSALGAAE